MTRRNDTKLDVFLEDIQEVHGSESLAVLGEALAPVAPPARLRAEVLDRARPEERLVRFLPDIAALLDLEPEAARAVLARVDDPQAWFELLPGICLLPAEGGARVRAALRGFVRVRAGMEFPLHEHLGEETVMIMQGFYADGVTGEVFGPGDIPTHALDTQHSFRVLSDGPDLLGLVVAHGGLRAQGQTFLPF